MYKIHRKIATAAISAVLGLMSLALSAKESYIGTDSTIVVRDYIANMEYVNGVLERVNFEGGYIDMTGESPRYMYYVTDHLGNVRTVVDEDGNVCQENHYYPYGDRFDDTRDMTVEESDNTRLFGGKEYSEDTGLHDFEARYDNTLFGRFTTLDPMAEKYYSVSPYAYCAGNPVRFVDSSGMDWYEDERGNILWTSCVNQESMDRAEIVGTYLGSTFVDFVGSRGEHPDAYGCIGGPGSVFATITVYGANGADDISHFSGYTMTSDPDVFVPIAEGVYDFGYMEYSKSGSLKSNWALNSTGAVPTMDAINNTNPSAKRDWNYGKPIKTGIFVHSTMPGGSIRGHTSEGCLLVADCDWDDFNKALNSVSNCKIRVSRNDFSTYSLQGIVEGFGIGVRNVNRIHR